MSDNFEGRLLGEPEVFRRSDGQDHTMRFFLVSKDNRSFVTAEDTNPRAHISDLVTQEIPLIAEVENPKSEQDVNEAVAHVRGLLNNENADEEV